VRGTSPSSRRLAPYAGHIAFVAAASPVHATRVAVAFTSGGGLPFRFSAVPVTLPVAEIVTRLDRLQPHALYGYPSMLALLAGEQAAGRLHLAPRTVTCTSETLSPDLRSAIRESFGVPVIDNFGSTEGLVGATPPDDPTLVFAEDGCIVELVDEHDRPVPPGTPSAAVLVTVLENRLQPLIRYRITDTSSSSHRCPVAGTCAPGSRDGPTTCCGSTAWSCTRSWCARCSCTRPTSSTTRSGRHRGASRSTSWLPGAWTPVRSAPSWPARWRAQVSAAPR
jgi:hypothetical protein